MESTPGTQYNDSSPALSLTVEELKDLVARAARDEAEVDVELAGRFEGGELVIRPNQADLQEKVLPIESFFHKIVMLRDRLRVLEQKINSNSKLSDGDKVELQQYITRIYGSLTTFNILFQYRDDHFRGQSGRG